MPDQERPRFQLRLTPELEALVIESAKKKRQSRNAEIVEALEWRYRPDAALILAEAIRPLLDTLTEGERANFVELVQAMAARTQRKRKRKRKGGP